MWVEFRQCRNQVASHVREEADKVLVIQDIKDEMPARIIRAISLAKLKKAVDASDYAKVDAALELFKFMSERAQQANDSDTADAAAAADAEQSKWGQTAITYLMDKMRDTTADEKKQRILTFINALRATELKPSTALRIEDILAVVTLVPPGDNGLTDVLARVQHGRETATDIYQAFASHDAGANFVKNAHSHNESLKAILGEEEEVRKSIRLVRAAASEEELATMRGAPLDEIFKVAPAIVKSIEAGKIVQNQFSQRLKAELLTVPAAASQIFGTFEAAALKKFREIFDQIVSGYFLPRPGGNRLDANGLDVAFAELANVRRITEAMVKDFGFVLPSQEGFRTTAKVAISWADILLALRRLACQFGIQEIAKANADQWANSFKKKVASRQDPDFNEFHLSLGVLSRAFTDMAGRAGMVQSFGDSSAQFLTAFQESVVKGMEQFLNCAVDAFKGSLLESSAFFRSKVPAPNRAAVFWPRLETLPDAQEHKAELDKAVPVGELAEIAKSVCLIFSDEANLKLVHVAVGLDKIRRLSIQSLCRLIVATGDPTQSAAVTATVINELAEGEKILRTAFDLQQAHVGTAAVDSQNVAKIKCAMEWLKNTYIDHIFKVAAASSREIMKEAIDVIPVDWEKVAVSKDWQRFKVAC